MIQSVSKSDYLVKRKYPFLENFPFNEFSIEAIGFNKSSYDDDYTAAVPTQLIKFLYEKGKSSMTIFVFEQELSWINEVSAKITDLNKIAKIIDSSIKSNDLLRKRNGLRHAEDWCAQLQDSRSRLSYSTSGEILTKLVDNNDQLVSIINKIVKLSIGVGLVGLSEKEYRIILTYYQFQLIYAKLLLGIVIASKISL